MRGSQNIAKELIISTKDIFYMAVNIKTPNQVVSSMLYRRLKDLEKIDVNKTYGPIMWAYSLFLVGALTMVMGVAWKDITELGKWLL